jgi:hypothetical protein
VPAQGRTGVRETEEGDTLGAAGGRSPAAVAESAEAQVQTPSAQCALD